ncbi:autotransporter assembly complex protein TamA [Psychrobacter sp. FDAARGOS_221]|uniref:autotransporter assembly complex protein TamA n=1 Tax=Psychrobacter sp. FDAARGOS_221 TaxID=1975705 RepID=UPI000BB56CEE|nr:BamA/TamA family outer membrane protein [Psychrobacter sp. FDAARGOS_221]PNK61795.1 outer membrane protein assembly factor [Psychrobacter sp. FDAARGOS_221]
MRNKQQPVMIATKSVSNKSSQQAVVQDGFVSNCKLSAKPPFRYSQLATALSLCLLAQAYLPNAAYAAVNDTDSQKNASSNSEPSQAAVNQSAQTSQSAQDQSSQTQALRQAKSDAELEQALIALRLKRAVEQGLVDASVLEDYQRETLNKASDESKSAYNQAEALAEQTVDKSIDNSTTNQKTNGQTNTGNQPATKQPIVQPYPINKTSPTSPATPQSKDSQSVNGSSNISNNGSNSKDSDAIFDRIFTDSSFDNQGATRQQGAARDFNDSANLSSPEQLDQLLNDIGSQVSVDFDQPVARLDAAEPPLGFNNKIDQSDSLHPSNRETLGIKSSESSTQQAATEPVYQATDVVTDPDNTQEQVDAKAKASLEQSNLGKVDDKIVKAEGDITDDLVEEVQKNGGQKAEINPDDYLPEYRQRPNGIDDELEQEQLAATDDTEKEPEAKQGLVKRLFNRFFNDGVGGLPKVKAKVYVNQTEEPVTTQQLQQALKGPNPQLVVADKEEQPAANIKAAMENIPAGSIADFTAATPKLYQEALDAAQAVGYYDVKLSFKKVASDEIAVVIDHLGEPVRVASRIVDIRGEGQELEEFQTIVDEAPPKADDVFNHGVYENTKREIETATDQLGFFDGQWLNRSVDVILPDNTADIDLIYDTGERYRFDEVVFFTIDEETGQLTTDPDKLPVKLELLHQLHEFKAGDSFSAPLVTKFTNDLSRTQYFNSVNVETIRPGTSRGVLGFEETEREPDEDQELAQADTDQAAADGSETDNITANDSSSSEGGLNSIGSNNTNNSDDSEDSKNLEASDDSDVLDEELAPVVYSINDETSEKLAQIRVKAERLSRLPDDRVLDEVESEAKSLLGKIANSISNTVKKVLPDDKDPYADTDSLPDDLSKTVLANRKTPQQVAESKSVPLYVFVSADKPRDMDIGIGYGTDTGVRAVTRFENNLINKDGYQAGITVGASKINRNINLHASRPWKHPLDDTLTGNISYEQEEINQGEGNLDLETNTIQAGITRNIRKENGWNRTYSLRYRMDQLESGVEGPAREDLPVPFNREGASFDQEALLLGYQIDKTTSDNVLNPTKGWRQYYSIEAGSENALTDTNMAIARAGVSGLYSFGEDNRHQILASLDGGYIWADDFERVPYKLRFFAGGDRSIRGYDYNSLSALEKGYLVGGQVLAVGSTEYNYEFKPGLRGAVFADFGNAYDKDFEAETKLGVGFGVRWASPVGMVRVDLGAGVLEDSIPIRLHFYIGSPLQ